MWTEQHRRTWYKVVCDTSGMRTRYFVKAWKWWRPFWWRCKGLQECYDIFNTVEEAKKAIPLYDKGACYWVGTMVDLTKERLGVSDG